MGSGEHSSIKESGVLTSEDNNMDNQDANSEVMSDPTGEYLAVDSDLEREMEADIQRMEMASKDKKSGGVSDPSGSETVQTGPSGSGEQPSPGSSDPSSRHQEVQDPEEGEPRADVQALQQRGSQKVGIPQ